MIFIKWGSDCKACNDIAKSLSEANSQVEIVTITPKCEGKRELEVKKAIGDLLKVGRFPILMEDDLSKWYPFGNAAFYSMIEELKCQKNTKVSLTTRKPKSKFLNSSKAIPSTQSEIES